MLQVWFNLLDLGLTPTVARETARFRGGAIKELSYLRLLRGLQIIFCTMAVLGGGLLFAFSGVLAEHWLNVQSLPISQVQLALQLMAVGVAFRWMSGLYRGCISGAEHLGWLGVFNVLIASIRFLGVMPFLIWIDSSPTTFFIYQTTISLLETAGLFLKTSRLNAHSGDRKTIGWHPKILTHDLRKNLQFSLSIAFTSTAWIIVSHTDRLLLSKYLPLADYGYFTLAVLAASAVLLINSPISSALVPRLTKLHAEGKNDELIALYCRATQLGTTIATPACVLLAFFPEEIIFSWTGDRNLSSHAAPVLQIYAVGNFLVALATFPYDLQLVKGNLKKHVQGNIIFIAFWIPSIAWSTSKYHAMGAAYTWLFFNSLYFFIWLPLVHNQFLEELHKKWALQNIAPIFAAGLLSAFMIRRIFETPSARDESLLLVLSAGFFITGCCLISSRLGRNSLTKFFKK